MSQNGVNYELRWLGLCTVAAIIVGYSFNNISACLIPTLFAFILWQIRRNVDLEKWTRSARKGRDKPDDFQGTCGEIADDIRLIRKRYEKDKLRLQSVVTRVQEMTSALTDGVILIDARGNIEWWNRAANLFFNFQEVDRGHRLVNIIRNPRFLNYYESNDFSAPFEIANMRKEGQHLEFHIHPFGLGERLIVIRDVTRMKRLEQMRKDFVSNVSHELRTPLTVIKGYLETIFDAPGIPPTIRKAIEQMCQQSNRMNALINDLITLTRLETEETESLPKPISLAPIVQSILSDAQALSPDNIHSFDFIGETSLAILGNESELRSAISNLVMNAVKYSPKGGKVTVEVVAAATGTIIRVHDEGLGIDPKHIPRITERFYRVDEGRSTAMGGTGLGLAIVKHVLMRHDAELRVTSRLGKGSTFSCHFSPSRTLQKEVA